MAGEGIYMYIKMVFAGIIGLIMNSVLNIFVVPAIAKGLGSKIATYYSFGSNVLALIWGSKTFLPVVSNTLDPIYNATGTTSAPTS